MRGASGRVHRETVSSAIGLMGDLTLESPSLGARLWYENQGRQFVIFDHTGRRESVLHLLAAAAPRIPYEARPGLAWDDVLPRRRFRPAWVRWLTDLVEPFLPDGRHPAGARGGAPRHAARGPRAGTSRAPVHRDAGRLRSRRPASLEVRIGNEVHRARRIEEANDA